MSLRERPGYRDVDSGKIISNCKALLCQTKTRYILKGSASDMGSFTMNPGVSTVSTLLLGSRGCTPPLPTRRAILVGNAEEALCKLKQGPRLQRRASQPCWPVWPFP